MYTMRGLIHIPAPPDSYIELGTQYPITVQSGVVVVVGANGSGKTSFGVFIEENNTVVHRITAQKSLEISDYVSIKSSDVAHKELLYGGVSDTQSEEWWEKVGRRNNRYNSNPATHLLDDFSLLLTLLFSEDYELSNSTKAHYSNDELFFQRKSKLDVVIEIWEEILPHKRLVKGNNSLIVQHVDTSNSILEYNGSKMSDGERFIFYLIGVVICTKPETILVIDEPELHLHRSIVKSCITK